ncbi:GIY-YIG nuclease family protein [Maridesulfovibrio salexigens]|uniref:DUF4357 domain-containing protein n=1 Tax=Maridesulfovibrio salexigens (strain ATCC 14822 / DSM 2638 / NCIMB 8403 / VKM B-1763) TaxID=526222 RepID=C6BZE8_MARSD|nr:GIY-YIG nuclease family protein [Maridesulfovibrio salexigens]ACS80785.1 conserved hypothetical protein [Maridesulfovibrio salexigens DSM 2638]
MSAQNSSPYSIKMFLPDGDPDGLRIIEKSNWTGVGVVFTRTGYKSALKRDEFQRTGVYVLVGSSEDSSLPTVYIGEGDPVRPRIDSHYAKKDFWNWGAFFVTSNSSLNKAHVKYLESRLIQMAKEARQCNLDNSNSSSQPNLAEADVADMDSFIQDMLSVFPLVGLSVFEVPEQGEADERHFFKIKAKGIKAQGYESSKGFVVQNGSECVLKEVPSIHEYLVTLRKDLQNKGVLAENDGKYLFTADYVFTSPSTAAGVILGRSSNGRICWKDEDGKTLKQVQTDGMEGMQEN